MQNRTLPIEPRHLLALTALRDGASFTAAAERTGYTQAAVSLQIAQIEQLVGTRVVERRPGRGKAELTGVGAVLAAHADGIIDGLTAAVADLRAGDELRVGMAHGALVPETLRTLARTAPGLQVTVHEASAEEIAAAVRAGALDAAIAELPLPDGPFEAHGFGESPIVLVAPVGRPDEDADLTELPLIAPAGPVKALVDARLHDAGVEAHWVLTGVSDAAALALVRDGFGAAVMHRMAVGPCDGDVAVRDLGDFFAPRRLVVFWHADRRRIPGLDTLYDALVDAAEVPA